MNIKSSEAVSITDMLFTDMLIAGIVDHGIHEPAHLLYVVVVEGVCSGDLRQLAYGVYAALGVVGCGQRKGSDYLGNGSPVVVANEPTKEDEASTHTVDY